MVWAETCSMKEKARFCMAYEFGEELMSELCRQFGISRKTGYQVLARWRLEGPSGLAERSHAPHRWRTQSARLNVTRSWRCAASSRRGGRRSRRGGWS